VEVQIPGTTKWKKAQVVAGDVDARGEGTYRVRVVADPKVAPTANVAQRQQEVRASMASRRSVAQVGKRNASMVDGERRFGSSKRNLADLLAARRETVLPEEALEDLVTKSGDLMDGLVATGIMDTAPDAFEALASAEEQAEAEDVFEELVVPAKDVCQALSDEWIPMRLSTVQAAEIGSALSRVSQREAQAQGALSAMTNILRQQQANLKDRGDAADAAFHALNTELGKARQKVSRMRRSFDSGQGGLTLSLAEHSEKLEELRDTMEERLKAAKAEASMREVGVEGAASSRPPGPGGAGTGERSGGLVDVHGRPHRRQPRAGAQHPGEAEVPSPLRRRARPARRHPHDVLARRERGVIFSVLRAARPGRGAGRGAPAIRCRAQERALLIENRERVLHEHPQGRAARAAATRRSRAAAGTATTAGTRASSTAAAASRSRAAGAAASQPAAAPKPAGRGRAVGRRVAPPDAVRGCRLPRRRRDGQRHLALGSVGAV
jgi:hypothetical protein